MFAAHGVGAIAMCTMSPCSMSSKAMVLKAAIDVHARDLAALTVVAGGGGL